MPDIVSALKFLFNYYITSYPQVLRVCQMNAESEEVPQDDVFSGVNDLVPRQQHSTPEELFLQTVWQNECDLFIEKVRSTLQKCSLLELQTSNPLLFWKELHTRAPHLSRAARDILCIPAQSAAAERIFSAMNTVVTKQRCGLKQKNIGPLVQSAMRYKQSKVLKRYVRPCIEDLPPLGYPQLTEALEVEDDDISEISCITEASTLDIDVDMDANMDNEEVGNNTIVLRDDGVEEYAEIMDVIDENF